MKNKLPKNPMHGYSAKQIIQMNVIAQSKVNGEWVPARPIQFWTIARIKSAWHVLTMKADALYWND